MVVGLVGALMLMGGVGTYLATIHPAYQADEAGHVGYTVSLRRGTLPSLDTPMPADTGWPRLERAGARPWPVGNPKVHMANNPPFFYAFALPAGEVSAAAGVAGGPLLGLRLGNLAGAVAAVALAYLLGRELAGADRFAGLVAAGIVSGMISVTLVSSYAAIDGPALAATTGVSWRLARFARTRTPSDAAWLGVWCAIAAGVRPMSLVFAGVAGALAMGLWIRTAGWRRIVGIGARLGGPTVVLVGWFYALNVRRYGDFTGTAALVEAHEREPGPAVIETLLGPEALVQPLYYLVAEVYGARLGFISGFRPVLVTVIAVAALLGAIHLAHRHPSADGGRRPSGPVPAAWWCIVVLTVVPVVLLAQHVANGGAGHPRYLLAVIPLLSAAAGLVVSRWSRWLGVALVAGFVVAKLSRVRTAGRLHLPAPELYGPLFQDPIVGQPYGALSLFVAAAGAVCLLGALASVAGMRGDG